MRLDDVYDFSSVNLGPFLHRRKLGNIDIADRGGESGDAGSKGSQEPLNQS